MTQQTIDIGATANDGTGDPLRDAFDKCNDNFTELYGSHTITGTLTIVGARIVHSGWTFSAPAAGEGVYGGSATDGATMMGKGSVTDNLCLNGSGSNVWDNPTGTRTFRGYGVVGSKGGTAGVGAGVGYLTGAGGSVTQATSKSTGVTLNKACGQITMNNAALAAATSVAFTLTNSEIAATDVIVVNIKSGATSLAYLTQVEAVAAGSCVIVLRNVSAGPLSEAVVLSFAILKGVTA